LCRSGRRQCPESEITLSFRLDRGQQSDAHSSVVGLKLEAPFVLLREIRETRQRPGAVSISENPLELVFFQQARTMFPDEPINAPNFQFKGGGRLNGHKEFRV
jgi:hypothetical protein